MLKNQEITVAVLFVFTLLFFTLGCIEHEEPIGYEENVSWAPPSQPNLTNLTTGYQPRNLTASLYGTVVNLKKVPLDNVTVYVIGNVSNYSDITDENGRFNVTGIQLGTYALVVWKEGYRNATLPNFTFIGGYGYPWNVTIARDCIYYAVNASTNYVVRYGHTATLYRGEFTCMASYPEGATYDVSPEEDNKLSSITVTHQAGNRMVRWELDNSKGRYSYIEGHIYVDLNGTQTMRLFDRKAMTVDEAAARQPGYLGSELSDDKETKKERAMIDPKNAEIKAIAQQIKKETGSTDVWTVAKALFVWLKNNTQYYNPESKAGEYTQSAIEVLHSQKGVCDELSYLYISLCRAVGIPARFVWGYIVKRQPGIYSRHTWVEFYDGEWVPVDVAGNRTNITHMVDGSFGVSSSNHVAVFVDNGTGAPINTEGCEGTYYDQPTAVTWYDYYDAIHYNPMFIAVCADGTRTLMKEKE